MHLSVYLKFYQEMFSDLGEEKTITKCLIWYIFIHLANAHVASAMY